MNSELKIPEVDKNEDEVQVLRVVTPNQQAEYPAGTSMWASNSFPRHNLLQPSDKPSISIWKRNEDSCPVNDSRSTPQDPQVKSHQVSLKIRRMHPYYPVGNKKDSGESIGDILSNRDRKSLVRNKQIFRCPLCRCDVLPGEGAILCNCLHSFCRNCLRSLVLCSGDSKVRCPFRTGHYWCGSYLRKREVKALLSPELFRKDMQRTDDLAKNQLPNNNHHRASDQSELCAFKQQEGDFKSFLNFCDNVDHLQSEVCKTSNSLHHLGASSEEAKGMEQDLLSLCSSRGETSEEKNYDALIKLNDVALVGNEEVFECPICFSDIQPGEGVVLHECLHTFCRICLAGLIEHSELAVVRCPFRTDSYSCESNLREQEIKSLVSPEVYQRHLQRGVMLAENQAENSFHCKTPNCHGWCFFEDDVNAFLCPICDCVNCLTCAAIHEGKNCKQFQDEVASEYERGEEAKKTDAYFQKMLRKGDAMKCPKCKVVLMKKSGCDWLQCPMCHTEICWVTKGPRWGPQGHGDVSGGCMCMVNGVRCHPCCGNCH